MLKQNNNMGTYFLDIKVMSAVAGYFAVSFLNIDIAMKIISFVFVMAFTARRWYLMEKNKKE